MMLFCVFEIHRAGRLHRLFPRLLARKSARERLEAMHARTENKFAHLLPAPLQDPFDADAPFIRLLRQVDELAADGLRDGLRRLRRAVQPAGEPDTLVRDGPALRPEHRESMDVVVVNPAFPFGARDIAPTAASAS